MKRLWYIAAFFGLLLVLSACAPGSEQFADSEAGFFSGIWHGWIAPISLIWHIFNDSIRVYEINNTGIWYDVGFYVAVIAGFGSISLTRRGKRKSKKTEK